MRRIAKAIERAVPGAHVNTSTPKGEKAITKLIVRADDAQIKIEVTPVLRGCVYEPAIRSVSARVESEFGFAEMSVVSFADLYAGKIVATTMRLRSTFFQRSASPSPGRNEADRIRTSNDRVGS